MANPTKISFTEPTQNTDGSAFSRVDLQGYVVSFDNTPFVDVDEVFITGGKVEVLLGAFNLPYGTHSVRVATVAKNGQISAPTSPVTLTLVDSRVPNPPTSLQVV